MQKRNSFHVERHQKYMDALKTLYGAKDTQHAEKGRSESGSDSESSSGEGVECLDPVFCGQRLP